MTLHNTVAGYRLPGAEPGRFRRIGVPGEIVAGFLFPDTSLGMPVTGQNRKDLELRRRFPRSDAFVFLQVSGNVFFGNKKSDVQPDGKYSNYKENYKECKRMVKISASGNCLSQIFVISK